MHVILRPSAQDDIDPIVVTGTLFAIGRQEPPFSAYDGELVAKLSRRHARLFDEDGSVYLADLGSLNGTSCNGEAVKHVPVEVHSGDVIEFGGLAFEAEVRSEVAEPVTAAPAVQRLVLTPERFKETLEPIVVSSFPFLFDKNSDLFSRHKTAMRDVLAYMSRHHAHIFLRDDQLYIEDLGSTNGTYVSGKRLDERARMLKDGDTIALGSERLVYSVHLLRSSEGTTQVPSGIEAVDNPTRTIFVDSATSFLDVYFVADRRGVGAEDASSENGSAGGGSGKGSREPGLATQISRSFFGGPMFGRTARRVMAGVVLTGVAAGGFWYWQGREVRAIETAMERREYATAVRLAHDYLDDNPDSPAIRELATRGVVRLWVPDWLAELEDQEFEAARAVAEEAARTVSANDDARAIMELLGWSARVRALLSEPVTADDINAAIERGEAVSELLEWWQGNTFSHARTLDLIAAGLPEFQSEREQVYSDVRRLRSEALDYRPLIDLGRALEQALGRGDRAAAGQAIEEFLADNPQFPDAGVLEQDLARLARLEGHVQEHRWLSGVRQLREDPFVTAPFADYGAQLSRRALPDEAAMARLEAATGQWDDGNMDAAIAGLEALSEGRWPGLGDEMLARYRELLSGYRELEASRGESDYAASLFEFYGTLRESEDGYLLAQLEGEFRDHAETAVRQAVGYLGDAEAAWLSYERLGGIQPEHRLAERVSGSYAELAGYLKRAAEALRRSQRIHRQIGRPLPEDTRDLEQAVSREVAFQRGQLESLAHHEPEVQRQLLSLLPEPL